MSLLQRAREDKPSALALYLVSRDALAAAAIVPAATVTVTCASYGISRQQVYEERARIEAALTAVTVAGRGRPARQGAVADPNGNQHARTLAMSELRIDVLEFRLANSGAMVVSATGRATYSAGFKRFALDAADNFVGTDEIFCLASGVPMSTLTTWRLADAKEPIVAAPWPERKATWPTGAEPNELARTLTEDFKRWHGDVGAFLRETWQRHFVAPLATRAVLRIAGLLPSSESKAPRYRGITDLASPGAIVVTDGKEIQVELTGSAALQTFNWQGIVDQATACHLAVVVSKTENAKAVAAAYTGACDFLGKPPLALVHDQKPIHDNSELRKLIEAATTMIPATLGRGQNKAVMEGQFGLWAQEVGRIMLDDTSTETLVTSAVHEIIRAYTSGINHSPRAEFAGKSRVAAVREACPDPKKDAELVAKLKASHQRGRHPATPLPTAGIARALLDEVFESFALVAADTGGRLRTWLAATFEPDAIRRAAAIFAAKRAKGALRGKHAHRYLVKLISGVQVEIDLEREEHFLLRYAETERRSWLAALIAAKAEIERESATLDERILAFADHAIFGGIFLEKAYWERELSAALAETPTLLSTVTSHIRRLYEAPALCRRRLLNRIVISHAGLERPLT